MSSIANTRRKWVEPYSLEEARERRLQLSDDIQGIMVQLGSLNRRSEDGRRMTAKEWDNWRQRALAAKRHKEREIGWIKSWINRHEEQLHHVAKSGNLALVLFFEAYAEYQREPSPETLERMEVCFEAARQKMAALNPPIAPAS